MLQHPVSRTLSHWRSVLQYTLSISLRLLRATHRLHSIFLSFFLSLLLPLNPSKIILSFHTFLKPHIQPNTLHSQKMTVWLPENFQTHLTLQQDLIFYQQHLPASRFRGWGSFPPAVGQALLSVILIPASSSCADIVLY